MIHFYPIYFFFNLLLLDKLYVSLLYIKCKIYSQKIFHEIKTIPSYSERLIYYSFLSIINLNLSILFRDSYNPFYIYILSIPYITILICEHPLYQYYYFQIYEQIVVLLIDISCHIITKFLNFSLKIIFNYNNDLIKFKEIRSIIDGLDKTVIINIFRIIGLGFIYDYFLYYYNIIMFTEIKNNKKKKKLLEEMRTIFKNRNWKYLLTPSMINKLFTLIHENGYRINKIYEKIFNIYIMIGSYITLYHFLPSFFLPFPFLSIIIYYLEQPRFTLNSVKENKLLSCLWIYLLSLFPNYIAIIMVLYSNPMWIYKNKVIFKIMIGNYHRYIHITLISICVKFIYIIYFSLEINSIEIIHLLLITSVLFIYYTIYLLTRININELIYDNYDTMGGMNGTERNEIEEVKFIILNKENKGENNVELNFMSELDDEYFSKIEVIKSELK